MTVIVRDFLPADAEAWVRVRRAALPYMVTTPAHVVFDLADDADNGPMLAINRWFGYEICATEVRHVRRIG